MNEFREFINALNQYTEAYLNMPEDRISFLNVSWFLDAVRGSLEELKKPDGDLAACTGKIGTLANILKVDKKSVADLFVLTIPDDSMEE